MNPPSDFLDNHEEGEAEEMAAGPVQVPSSRETGISLSVTRSFPGFRFSPTDEELISYYLKRKIDGCEKSVEIISEIEICRHEPWDLPAKSMIESENEWFFFSARGRKYPNGSQSRRATVLGYWKATGKERHVKSGSKLVIGTKRTLVFHLGRAPKGERTEWIMHEYCIDGKSQDAPVICRVRRNTEFRLNDASNTGAAPLSQRQLAITGDSNGTVSGTGITDQIEEGGDKGAEALSGRARSSYDSHSVDQFNSTPETNQKLANDVVAHTFSSTPHKEDSGDDEEDDFYADILKDEIIKLDESTTTLNLLQMEKSWLETVERESLESLQGTLSPIFPAAPNTVSRRVRFKDQPEQEQEQEDQSGNAAISSALEALGIDPEEYHAEKDKSKHWRFWPTTCLVTTSLTGDTIGLRVSARMVVIALFVLAVFLLGGFHAIKIFAQDHPSLFWNLWK